jgi:scyllo-inositol 2-dehydrogenase (NADP+)
VSKLFNVALVSYGLSGRVFHAPFLELHPQLNLAVILERSKNESKSRYPHARIVRHYEEILSAPDIDLVIINTPNPLHYPMAKAALEAGKHVVVEKPFTVTVDEGRALIALAKECGLMLSVYHNRRLQSGIQTAQKLFAEQQLGELKTYEVTIDRYRPALGPKKWKEESNPGAGLLYDLGSHLLDESLVLFGWPHAVTADLRVERANGQVCDYFHIRLDYPGHKVILKASMLAREPAPAYVIHGDKGSYIKTVQDVQEGRLAEGLIPDRPGWSDEQPEDWGLLHNDSGRTPYPTVPGCYERYYENIHEHLTQQVPLLVTPEEALRAIELIDIVQQSAAEKRTLRLS